MLPISGPISFRDLNVELGRDPDSTISLNDVAVRNLAGIPYGEISLNSFRANTVTYEYENPKDFLSKRQALFDEVGYDLNKVIIKFKDITADVTNLFSGTKITHTPRMIVFSGDCYLDEVFKNTPNLIWVSPALFSNCNGTAYSGAAMFENSNIASIPEEFFDCKIFYSTPTFDSVFRGCRNLKNVPKNLFKNNVMINTLASAFEDCVSLTEHLDFSQLNYLRNISCIYKNSGLLNIEDGIFFRNYRLSNTNEAFSGTKITTTGRLYLETASNPSVGGEFKNCKYLESLPTGLYGDLFQADTFGGFQGCSSLKTLPRYLFTRTPVSIKNMDYLFKDCTSLETLPDNFIANNFKSVYSCTGLFENCTSLVKTTTKDIYTILNTDKSRRFNLNYMFKNCVNLTSNIYAVWEQLRSSVYEVTYVEYAKGCTKASNYLSIPSAYK